MWLSKDTFYELLSMGWVVDGRAGGFVLGRSHNDGNIYMIQEFEEGKFCIPSNLEGGEFVLNYQAYEQQKDRLNEINQNKDSTEEPRVSDLGQHTRVLNTSAYPHDKLLWIDSRGQFIVNKISTMNNLAELHKINNEFNDFNTCNLDSIVPKDSA